MSGELNLKYSATNKTILALILGPDRTTRWNGSAMVAISSVSSANWTTGMVTLTEQATSNSVKTATYVGDFPTGITTAGDYAVEYYLSTAATPGSQLIGIQDIYWDGAAANLVVKADVIKLNGKKTDGTPTAADRPVLSLKSLDCNNPDTEGYGIRAYGRIGFAAAGFNYGAHIGGPVGMEISGDSASLQLSGNGIALYCVTCGNSIVANYTSTDLATSASQTSILDAVNAITTNTARSMPVVPTWFVRPASGSTAYVIDLYIYNLQGVPETPDAAPTIHARTASGSNDLDNHLASTTMTLVATGHYRATYTVQSTDTAQAVYFSFAWAVGGIAMADAAATQVQDAESLATMLAIKAKTDNLPSDPASASVVAAIKAKTDNLPASPAATSDIPTANIAAIKAKTDNLPASPAATSDIPTSNISAIKAKTDNLPSDPASASVVSAIKAKTDNLPASPAAVGSAMTLTSAYDAAKTAAQAGDAMTLQVSERNAVAAALLDLANALDGKTVRQALRIIAAVLAGKVSGAGSGTETFRGLDDQQNRVVVTADVLGNRTNVTYQ
jgi:hypothetical protein